MTRHCYRYYNGKPSLARQQGFTLIELLVAMTLSLLVVGATVGVLTMARQGFIASDASGQLRDNTRFAVDVLQKIVQQAGYRDVKYASATRSSEFKYIGMAGTADLPPILGFNNSLPASIPSNSTNSSCNTSCVNNSDVLIASFQTSATANGSEIADGTMITCSGGTNDAAPAKSTDRLGSAFYVQTSSGEPTLMCAYLQGGSWIDPIPLVQGVETFQVLYGVDAVAPNTAASSNADTVPDRYLRADELVVNGDAAATRANWLRVRSVRIGMVLRGPVGSAVERNTPTYYPLGSVDWSSTSDGSSAFVAAADGRLRQTFTFTVYLPNPQEI